MLHLKLSGTSSLTSVAEFIASLNAVGSNIRGNLLRLSRIYCSGEDSIEDI